MKPENWFVKNPIFKLGDFGFATQKRLLSTTLGTYPYMAPELFSGSYYDYRCDIWSLGVILHELLTGELYFFGPSQEHIK